MASRRSGFSSLVHRHQLQELLSDSQNGDKDPAKKQDNVPSGRHDGGSDEQHKQVLRVAYGNEDLRRLAGSIETQAPWSGPALELFFGPTLQEEEARASNWLLRPRPEKPALDLKPVTAEHQEFVKRKAEEAKKAKNQAEIERNEANDRAEAAAALASKSMEETFADVVKKKRTIFFGRPSQQIRLLKRGLQIERNKAEYYCAMWKHLLEEANEEYEKQDAIYKEALRAKAAAALSADNLRGKEIGARQSALKLKAIHLLDASEQSNEAAQLFARQASEEEQKARVARAVAEDAKENMECELEKMRACEVQIESNRREARRILDLTITKEVEEIFKVIEEENLLTESRQFFVESLNNCAPLSSLAKSFQDDVDRVDRRLALLAMEQEMFRPFYTQIGTGQTLSGIFTNDKGETAFTVVRKAVKKNPTSTDGGLVAKKFEWKQWAQCPGTVCLGPKGKEADGILAQRAVVIDSKNELKDLFKDDASLENFSECFKKFDSKQKDWHGVILKELLKPANENNRTTLLEDWNSLQRTNLCEIQDSIELMSDYFAKEDAFESRVDKAKKAGARTILDKETFSAIWVKRHCIDSRIRLARARKDRETIANLENYQLKNCHEVAEKAKPGEGDKRNILDIDRVTVRLRCKPTQLWMTSWVETGKPLLSPLNNNPFLGPKLRGLTAIKVPPLHDDDISASKIMDPADGRPRRYAILSEVKKKLNDNVKAGEELIVLKVFNERKMGPDMKTVHGKREWSEGVKVITASCDGKFTGLCPAIWKQKGEKDRGGLSLLDWNEPKTHGFFDQQWVESEMLKKKKSPDLLYCYNLKFYSFEIIAYIDRGENDWNKKVLPIDEWPAPLFNDFKDFFLY